jgi:predicted transcriptional regulator
MAAIKHRIKRLGLRPAEVRRLFLGQASVVLSGKRPISPSMMLGLHETLGIPLIDLIATRAPEAVRKPGSALKPAVPIAQSVTPERIVCLECGRRMSYLKNHLRAAHGLTPDAYRVRWGLLLSYPLVAPDYAERRRVQSERHGFGSVVRGTRGRRGRFA